MGAFVTAWQGTAGLGQKLNKLFLPGSQHVMLVAARPKESSTAKLNRRPTAKESSEPGFQGQRRSQQAREEVTAVQSGEEL